MTLKSVDSTPPIVKVATVDSTAKPPANPIEIKKEIVILKDTTKVAVIKKDSIPKQIAVVVEPVKIVKPIVNNTISTTNKRYTVQVGAFVKKQKMVGVPELFEIAAEGGVTKYLSGKFDTHEQAATRRTEMIKKGFDGAFIVVLEDGKLVK